MTDERVLKIIDEFNNADLKLYGFSTMPRFVVLRNVKEDFDFSRFFMGLNFQHDKKLKRKVTKICKVKLGEETYFIGLAQFATYDHWKKAFELTGKYGIVIEPINDFHTVQTGDPKLSIDRIFTEAEAIDRPRATYICSLAVNSVFQSDAVKGIAAFATNNRFLQNTDHRLYTYN